VDAGVAAGDRSQRAKHLLDDEAEGQRGDAQVDALHAQRRQADDHADRGRQRRPAASASGNGQPMPVSTACV
jgi:hypothetical protein